MVISKIAYADKTLECVKNSWDCSFYYFVRNTINTNIFNCTLSLAFIHNIKIKKAGKNPLAKRMFATEMNGCYGNPNWDVPIVVNLCII